MPAGPTKDLMDIPEVAEYLGIERVTVYRWCRDGRLPCLKLGREWRLRRTALEEFLRRAEEAASLVGRLRAFYTIPDHVVACAQTAALQQRLDVAFFQVGEAHDGLLVKFVSREAGPVERARAQLAAQGLEVGRLEAAGWLRFVEEVDPVSERTAAIRRLQAEGSSQGRSLWIAMDWLRQVGVEEALRQQEVLRTLVGAGQLVIQTCVLEHDIADWSVTLQRHTPHVHLGAIWISEEGLLLTRVAPLPVT